MYIVIFLFATTLLYWVLFRKVQLALPGPRSWPIVGCIYQLHPVHPHLTFSEWAEKYGPVFKANLYTHPVVFVNSYDAIYDVLVKRGDVFADRGIHYRLDMLTEGQKNFGMAPYSSPHRHLIRKAIQKHVKLYSSGSEDTENVITSEINKQMDQYSAYSGEAFDIYKEIYKFAQSVMHILVFGERLEDNNEDAVVFKKLVDLSNSTVAWGGRGSSLDTFPWLRYVGHPVYRDLTNLKKLITSIWQRKKAQYIDRSSDKQGTCGLKTLMQLMKDNGTHVQETNIKLTMVDLMIAGTATTTHSLAGFLCLLVNYRDVQHKVQLEVDSTVRRQDKITLASRDAMPYTRAAIYELQRYITVAPLGVMHANTMDTTINGYFIPKGTNICTNLWHLHHEKDIWGDPWTFRPERYIDESGNLLPADHPNRKRMLAFGAGPRVCLGEVFALNRMFLYIANLLQKFDVFPEKDGELPPCDPRSYVGAAAPYPEDFKVRLVPRE